MDEIVHVGLSYLVIHAKYEKHQVLRLCMQSYTAAH